MQESDYTSDEKATFDLLTLNALFDRFLFSQNSNSASKYITSTTSGKSNLRHNFSFRGRFLTLPENGFITDVDPQKHTTVPSLCFLIRHPSSFSKATIKLIFDLGLKRDLTKYTPAQHHIAQRQPASTDPDVAVSLREGGVKPEDVDVVIQSI